MLDRGGQLEVEVNQARGLTPKPSSKNIPGTPIWHQPTVLNVLSFLQSLCPGKIFFLRFSVTLSAATYVKVYVLENGVCLAKKKTKVVKKNLDPTYQQALLFDESPQGKVLQVWDLHPINQHSQISTLSFQILLEAKMCFPTHLCAVKVNWHAWWFQY